MSSPDGTPATPSDNLPPQSLSIEGGAPVLVVRKKIKLRPWQTSLRNWLIGTGLVAGALGVATHPKTKELFHDEIGVGRKWGNDFESLRLNALNNYKRIHDPELVLTAEDKVMLLGAMHLGLAQLKEERSRVLMSGSSEFTAEEMPKEDTLRAETLEWVKKAVEDLHADDSLHVTWRVVKFGRVCLKELDVDSETMKEMGLDDEMALELLFLGARRCMQHAKDNPESQATAFNDMVEHFSKANELGLAWTWNDTGIAPEDVSAALGLIPRPLELILRSKLPPVQAAQSGN